MANRSVNLIARYDDFSDVLYVSRGKPAVRVRTRDGSDGLLLRVSPEGDVVGVTVEDFHYRWAERMDDLIASISAQMSVDAAKLGAAIA